MVDGNRVRPGDTSERGMSMNLTALRFGMLILVAGGFVACGFVGCSESPPRLALGSIELAGPPGSGEPNAFATADGRVLLTWFEPLENGHALMVAERTADDWSKPQSVAVHRDFFVNWADFPSPVELADGSWAVHWLEKVAADPYAYHVKVAVSHDRGASWGEPFTPHSDRSPTEHGFVSMVPWGDGAAAVWLDGRKLSEAADAAEGSGASVTERGEMTLRATTFDSNGAVGDEILLDDRTCECCQTALVHTGPGTGLLAAYRDRSQEEIRNITVVRFEHGEWSEPLPVADDGWYYPGCPVNGPQLAARGDTVAIAWFTAPDNAPAVYVAYSFDAGATFGERIRVDEGEPLGRVDVELLPNGLAAVAWLERTDEEAAVRVRIVEADGGVGPATTVSATSESRSSGFPRMARTGDSLLIAWTMIGDDGGMRVASLRLAE